MDNMVDRVAEIDNGEVNLYKGNYSKYLVAREERLERIKAERAKSLEEIAHSAGLRRSLPLQGHQCQAGPGARAAHREDQGDAPVIPEEKKTVHFNFVQPPRHGR